jgi:hypothetical protein
VEEFIEALRYPEAGLDLVETEIDSQLVALKVKALTHEDENEASRVWCAQSIAGVQRRFIAAFAKLKDSAFYEAWCEFEHCEIELRNLLEHFTSDESDSHRLLYIQRMVERWQSLYPYKIFLSPEFLKKKIACSICKQRITPRANCGHKKGNLYQGEMCHHVVEEVDLISISLVENPVQRYSVAFLANEDGTQRDHYDYGNIKFVVDRVESSFHEWTCEWTTRVVTGSEVTHVPKDHPCLCLSEKKFGECCFNKPAFEVPHLQIGFLFPPARNLPSLELLV